MMLWAVIFASIFLLVRPELGHALKPLIPSDRGSVQEVIDNDAPWLDPIVIKCIIEYLQEVVLFYEREIYHQKHLTGIDKWGRLLGPGINTEGRPDGEWQNPAHFVWTHFNDPSTGERYDGVTVKIYVQDCVGGLSTKATQSPSRPIMSGKTAQPSPPPPLDDEQESPFDESFQQSFQTQMARDEIRAQQVQELQARDQMLSSSSGRGKALDRMTKMLDEVYPDSQSSEDDHHTKAAHVPKVKSQEKAESSTPTQTSEEEAGASNDATRSEPPPTSPPAETLRQVPKPPTDKPSVSPSPASEQPTAKAPPTTPPSPSPSSVGGVPYYLVKGEADLQINGVWCKLTAYLCMQCKDEDIKWLLKIAKLIVEKHGKVFVSTIRREECVKTAKLKAFKVYRAKGPSKLPIPVPAPSISPTNCPCADKRKFQEVWNKVDVKTRFCFPYELFKDIKLIAIKGVGY